MIISEKGRESREPGGRGLRLPIAAFLFFKREHSQSSLLVGTCDVNRMSESAGFT